ncbi:tetratricopeptide repeat protein [Persicitalea jodogahamensis]|nr:tetratricopeptide repeat protein [Persicitalea jodogahamensis]
MKTNISRAGRLLFFALSICAATSLLTSCADKEGNTENAADASPMSIPPLFQRTGELSKADEWSRTIEKVDELKAKISKDPNDVKARLQIATIYMAEARITGEHPYYYPAVLKILDGVLSIDPRNFEATTFKASVKMSQHQFAEARDLAEQARQINPDNAYVYGVLVDANVELGDYEQAVAMSDKMQAMKPSLESYSRASYLREIYGNYPGAISAMQLAVDAGLPGSEPYCWSKYTLAHLYTITGQLDKAEREYAEILAVRPSYAFALGGQAHVQRLRKQYDKALATLDQAAAIMPEFSFHEEMAEIYALQGDQQKAADKYVEVVTMLDEDAQSGHSVDLEMCKLYTKLGKLDSAAVYGQREYSKRPKNIDVNHAMAAVAFKQDNVKKAQEYIEVAMRTGSKNPELLRQASEIELAMGNEQESKKLIAEARKVNPNPVL